MRGPALRRERVVTRYVPRVAPGRVPPHDLDAEAAVLSAILLSQEALDRVLEILKPEHFYSDANGRIYEAALALALAGTPIDIVSVASYLRDRERIGQIGGPTYLAQLADATPAVAHVGAHARVVYEKWRLRALIATCQRVAAEGYGDVGDAQAFIDDAEQGIYELAHTAQTKTGKPIREWLALSFKQIYESAERGDRITGLSTGYEKIDRLTAGLHPGELTILAARPGMGKTSLATCLAVNVATPAEGEEAAAFAVQVFSQETPGVGLATRMACSEARVDMNKVREGYLQPEDWRRLTDAGAFLTALPIWIEDTTGIGILELRAKVRRRQAELTREGKGKASPRLGLVVVDYLQIMKGREELTSREQQVSEIARGLKNLAMELNVPVLALSQLNRAVETRTTKDKRPQLSDLRESGEIEQAADNVFFIYRDEYYNPDTTDAKGIAEVLLAKQRNGPTGKALLKFTASYTRFDNLAAGDYPEVDDG